MSAADHVMRTELALALGGIAVFCTCGRLTGFAGTDRDAGLIHDEHVARARARELADTDDERAAAVLARRRRARAAVTGGEAA